MGVKKIGSACYIYQIIQILICNELFKKKLYIKGGSDKSQKNTLYLNY